MAKRTQPLWSVVDPAGEPVLKLYNSLTRQKEVFVPKNGNKVSWYSCGPTVYDASHMGHARSYITFDILRRVLADYFGYDILYVMNITDIDDKIIKRARQNYLFDRYKTETRPLEELQVDATKVLQQLEEKLKSTADTDKLQMLRTLKDKFVACHAKLSEQSVNPQDFLEECRDSFAEWLDSKLGSTVEDNDIFSALPTYWENEFHKDMEALNILKPHVLTRVSEYTGEIIEFIKKIIDNGLAYESNGSVYFDVGSFDGRKEHHYAKLVPEAYGDASSLQEGEGDLSSAADQSEKRSPNDFALWKSSKPGEPRWESPWGLGRPGWHIECSAMASAVCGNSLDIHTGGVDLKFPHHDNEIAQTEAYYGSSEWVKYFLHSGHLTIAGCKMSKSLKNFVSIQDALRKYSARQLRFGFLMHSWKDTLDYSDNTMESALQCERLFNEFFLNVKDLVRRRSSTSLTFQLFSATDMGLLNDLVRAKAAVHAALCDNVDTRGALDVLRDLVAASNVYLRDHRDATCNVGLLRDVALYITRVLRVFGTIESADETAIGFPVSGAGGAFVNVEETVMPYLTILAEFRDQLRVDAKAALKSGGDSTSGCNFASTVLRMCDRLRDDVLPAVGVRLEDRDESGAGAVVKLCDRDTLLKERETKRRAEAEKAAERERKKEAAAAAAAAKEAQRRVVPADMFRDAAKYSQYDENGIPTHDAEGKEISKGQIKKLQKLHQAQKKLHDEYLVSIA